MKCNNYSGVKKIDLRGLKEKCIVKDNKTSGTTRSSVETRCKSPSRSTTENQ